MKKQNLVAFLIDNKNNWIEKYIKKITSDKFLKKKYKLKNSIKYRVHLKVRYFLF